MKIGFSGEEFGNLILIAVFVMVSVIGLIGFAVHQKGIDVTKHKIGLAVGVGCLLFFGIVPFWFTELTIIDKSVLTTIAVVVAVGNYFAIDKIQMAIREHLRDKK